MTRPLETRATLHVVVGIVGAGKTTFLQHLLDAPDPAGRGRPPAVVVGEHADEGFDDAPLSATGALVEQLVRTSDDPTGGYSEPIRRILLRSEHGRIYLETSGVTRIGHVVRALLADGDIAAHARIGRAVTVLDAGAFSFHARLFGPQVWAQIAMADVVVVNKTDKVPRSELVAIGEQLRARRPDIPVHFTYMGQLPDRQAILGPLPDGFRPALLDVDFGADPPLDFDSFVYRSDVVCRDRVGFGHRLLNLEGSVVARAKGRLRCWDCCRRINAVPGQLDWDNTPVAEGPTAIALLGIGLSQRRAEITAMLDEALAAPNDWGA